MMLTAPNISRTRHRVMSRAFKCKIAGNLWRCVVTRALLLMVSGEVTGGHFRNFNHQSSAWGLLVWGLHACGQQVARVVRV